MAILNEAQSRSILSGFLDIHRRMSDLEALLQPGERPSAFSEYVNDIAPTEAKVLRDYFARIRTAMLGHLKELQIPVAIRPMSRRWAIQTGLQFLSIAVAELRPSKLRGYGELRREAPSLVTKICEDLDRPIDQVIAYLRQGLGSDLEARLSRLGEAQVDVATLARLEEVVARWQLVEFRPAIEMIVSRMENPCFEVAVFGRVSCGKSSLLNHIAGIAALPVGVTPVTAVPTRLVCGDEPSVSVSFAESRSRDVGLEHLREYASEEGNPGNSKHVTSILVKLPSPRLREGIAFVDTPGVGSLALTGGAETLAYLPRCDLGVVLVDAASTLDREDLALLRALYEVGIPAMVLLSKADLLVPDDRVRMTDYIRAQVRRELGLELPVHPVSTVGDDESLLTAWFGQELAPLLDRHRTLAEGSLKRKIAHLRESVIATLETLQARRARGGRGDGAEVDTRATQQLLDKADAAIRRAREHTSNWWEGRRALAEEVPHLVARAVVSVRGPADDADPAEVIGEALRRRGREARDLVAGLKETLSGTLQRLSGLAPLAHADPSTIRDFHVGGLPALDLHGALCDAPVERPWWSGLAPSLAVRATERSIREQAGRTMTEAVEFYDRQLESWLKTTLARLIENYETQAAAFREQIRRLVTESPDAVSAGQAATLEADLREIRGTSDDAGAALPGFLRVDNPRGPDTLESGDGVRHEPPRPPGRG
jgi:GTP-binding protein EngB required for normal cell division